MKIVTNEGQQLTSATRQVRQQWFSGCIFPLDWSLVPQPH